MTYSYYPGCTLKTKAKDLDIYTRESAKALGIELEEIENWQCCGGVYPLGGDEIATKLSSVRTLCGAKQKQQPLVTVCSACHNVLKRVNDDMKNNIDMRDKVNRYNHLDEPYGGETKVIHYLELLNQKVGFDALKNQVKNSMEGRKIGAYYGCLLLRPGSIMDFDDPENPVIMEQFIEALGAEAVYYSQRNECCGGYVSLMHEEQVVKQVDKVVKSAVDKGAQCLITACPLCMYNLQKSRYQLPIYYFAEILAQALGIKDEVKKGVVVS